MKFNYRARTREGKMETGTIDAYSKEAASLLLQKYNVFVTSLEPHEKGSSFFANIKFRPRVSKKNLTIFFRQLAIMLDSRVPVVASLASLASQTTNKGFREIISDVSNLVQEGAPLSGALAAYPSVFDSFYINLVKSGEASGNISTSLTYIANHLESENDILVQLRQAMLYPVFVLCVLVVVIAIIIVEVMPRISDLIKESGAKPSAFTSFILRFYDFLGSYWWAILAALVLVVGVVVLYFRTKEGKKNLAILLLKIPFLGGLLKKVFLTRFCSNISTLISAGVSIQSALKIAENTVNNAAYKQIASQIEKQISEGEKISYVM